MTEIERDISEIKQSLEQIKAVLGIGRVAPATVVQMERRVKQRVAKLNERWKKRRLESV